MSENTIISYLEDLKLFNKSIKKDILSITENDIIVYLKDKEFEASSKNRKITVFRGFFNFLVLNEFIFKNPTENLESLKTSKRLPKYLTEDEINKLLNFKCESKYDYRNKAMIELMYATGLRVSELCNLKVSDIDLHNSVLRCITKGNKERIIPIGQIANVYLNIYINNYRDFFIKKSSDYLFLNNKGSNISRQGFYINLENICRMVGIKGSKSSYN